MSPRIGINPFQWRAHADSVDRHSEILDELAMLGYEAVQAAPFFPKGIAFRAELERHQLRLSGAGVSLHMDHNGPDEPSQRLAREVLGDLQDGGGEYLIVQLDLPPERKDLAGRAAGAATPRLNDSQWRTLAQFLDRLGAEARALGRRVAFHNHSGGYVETPEEIARLMSVTSPEVVDLCLDTGHAIVGGADPSELVAHYGPRITYLHVKDVDPEVLARVRRDGVPYTEAVYQQFLFTEVGSGQLAVGRLLAELGANGFEGWLVVEQDASRFRPLASAGSSFSALSSSLRETASA